MIELNVKDMTCGHCTDTVTRAVKSIDPEAQVQVDLGSKRVRVQGRAPEDALIRALNDAGYPAVPASAPRPAMATRVRCCCS